MLPPTLNTHSQLTPEDNEYLIFLYSDVITRSYETVTLMYEIIMMTLRFASRLPRLLQLYIPNIFKILAHRPTTFAREIAMILPHLYHSTVLMELFYSIVQLPVLSAAMLARSEVCSVYTIFPLTKNSNAHHSSIRCSLQLYFIKSVYAPNDTSPSSLTRKVGSRKSELKHKFSSFFKDYLEICNNTYLCCAAVVTLCSYQ